MLRTFIIAFALALGLAMPAQASSCPTISKEITQKLESSSMPAAQKAEVVKLRDQGDALHRQGKHAESVAVLRRALSMIK